MEPVCHHAFFDWGHAMNELKDIKDNVAAAAETASSIYVPSLQLTDGQAPPIAANGGLSYMSFDRDVDAGTAAALVTALTQVAQGQCQAVSARADHLPPLRLETPCGDVVPQTAAWPG